MIIAVNAIKHIERQEHVEMPMFAIFAFFWAMRMVKPARLVAIRDTIPFGIMIILNERGVCRYHSWY